MSGTYKHLAPGRYQLEVEAGEGPAGVRRPDGRDVVVGVGGGARSFFLDRDEHVYYWWRGPRPRPGVRLSTRESRTLAAPAPAPRRRVRTGPPPASDTAPPVPAG